MGSPSFGLPSSNNNAPLPIPGNTNPTGTNSGVGFGGVSFPNYPMFGSPSTGGPTSPSANAPLFSGGSGNSLTSLFTNPLSNYYSNTDFWNQVGKAYGKGTGQALETEFGQLFNPQVVANFLNAQQPGIARNEATIQNSFGAEGSRFGSAAALGLGDYESQVNLNEQQTISQMYMNAVNQEIGVTEGLLPSLHAEQANKGGWEHDVIGGLEIAGGIAATIATGGAAAPIGIGLIGAGAGQLGQGMGGGGSSAQPNTSAYNLNTGTFGSSAPLYQPNSATTGWNNPASPYYLDPSLLDASAGSSIGGSDAFSNFDPSTFSGDF